MAYRENIETASFLGRYMIRRTLMRYAYNREIFLERDFTP